MVNLRQAFGREFDNKKRYILHSVHQWFRRPPPGSSAELLNFFSFAWSATIGNEEMNESEELYCKTEETLVWELENLPMFRYENGPQRFDHLLTEFANLMSLS